MLHIGINSKKLEMGLDKITFMGHHIMKDGFVVDPEKSELSETWKSWKLLKPSADF